MYVDESSVGLCRFCCASVLNNIFVIVCLPMTLPKKFTDFLWGGFLLNSFYTKLGVPPQIN